MPRITAQFNDFVSLAVMLLMFVALLGGQSNATTYAQAKVGSIEPIVMMNDHFSIGLDGHIGDQALKMGIAVATELSHFRGEDE